MKRYSLHLLVVLIVALVPLLAASPASAENGFEMGTTYAAFQQYQNGYMLWRADTGGIWVFVNTIWTATYFPEAQYKNLPDNPVIESTPDQLVRPVSGFGRVWGNFADVRAQLGWALSPEVGYTTSFESYGYSPGGLAQMIVALPIQIMLLIRADGTWGYRDQVRPISSLPNGTTMPITWQTFEHGYMMYWPETGSIWVLSAVTGRADYYDSLAYGALLDNPISALPPAGFLKPILGFGKVWGNFPLVRQSLGWAAASEIGYTTTFQRLAPLNGAAYLAVQEPSGLTVVLRDNGTWYIN